MRKHKKNYERISLYIPKDICKTIDLKRIDIPAKQIHSTYN